MKITDQHGPKFYSQNNEDAIIAAILEVIGDGKKTFIEIGTGDGAENNTSHLRRNCGWSGVMIDKCIENADVRKRYITAENVQQVLHDCGAVRHPDVLSLDIDGVDWWVLSHLGPYLPRLLVYEFNGHFQPHERLSIPYDPDFSWGGTRFYGASLKAMHDLGKVLGFSLVYSNMVNAFMVRDDYRDLFDNADDPAIYTAPWSHKEDPRMHLMIDPFTVKDWVISYW